MLVLAHFCFAMFFMQWETFRAFHAGELMSKCLPAFR
jgi:hypothetical protein